MKILGSSQFDQCVLNMALINLCNQQSYVGEQLLRLYNRENLDEPSSYFWRTSHWFSIYVPHSDQQFDEISLEQGLTYGYNIEIQRIEYPNQIPYDLPQEAHFVTVLKQKGLNQNYDLAATGIFVRPLAILKLDIIDHLADTTYQPILITHPILRDYPASYRDKLWQYLDRQISSEALPNLVGYVDQALNSDLRSPTWSEVLAAGQG